ncbi:MAG TPA: PLD nuclease N-terminal domain-containing protein [Actinomycetota bacterium]|nr:PLD nuclease N-terminal domain-containing protein [Actinomycetota bacterium]
MLLIRGLVFVAAIGIWFYCIYDVIRTDAAAIQHLHKVVWLAFVLLVPTVGALAWLFLGRPEPIGSRLFEPRHPAGRAPDDSPEFLASLSDEIKRRRRAEEIRAQDEDSAAIDEEIRRLEEELKRRAEEERGDEPS